MSTEPMVVVQQSFRVATTEGEDIHAHAEAVMGELVELSEAGSILDASVSSDIETGIVLVEVTVGTDDLDEAMASASSAARTAIHASGGHTPGWPTHEALTGAVRERVSAEIVTDR